MEVLTTKLRFELFEADENIHGYFDYPSDESWEKILEQFNNSHEKYQSGYYTEEIFISECKAILKKEPEFLDAYAQIGNIYLNAKNFSDASRWYKRGLSIALPLIAENFSGQIHWGNDDNRPFLRLHHGSILCAIRLGRMKVAIEQMEQHLLWNPHDNIGIRYLLGDVYLTIGTNDKAKEIFMAYGSEYPPYQYSLGLLEFKCGNYIKAATALRIGFAGNSYIAEALTGRVSLRKHSYWHSTSDMYPETALSYLELLGAKNWAAVEEATDFLDWLFNCADVLNERADITAPREALLYENDIKIRIPLLSSMEQLLAGINDNLSEMLIRKVRDRNGNFRWPWQM
ncbi:MAG: hypothetical protein WCP96_03035 [Methylococcaceae bacterium]